MRASSDKKGVRRTKRFPWSSGWLERLLRIGDGAAPLAPSIPVPDSVHRPATAAPALWQDFAMLVQSRLQQWLAMDQEFTAELKAYLAKEDKKPNASLIVLIVRIWISRVGTVDRIEVVGLGDSKLSLSLRKMAKTAVGSAPPADMPQPIHLKLSLGHQQ